MLSVITDIAELEALRPDWSRLWRDDPRATPFQSPEWLLPWWHHLFRGGQLWTVARYENGRLVSLVPLFRYGAENEHLTLIGTGVSDYLDSLGEPGERIPGNWQRARLEEIRPASNLLNLGIPEACSVCPVIILPECFDDLMRQIDPKLAVDIRRSTNRLERAGEIRVERTTDLDALFELHGKRWQDRNEEGMLAEASVQKFHREVAEGFEKLGILRLYQLLVNDRAAGVIYAFAHRARTYAYLSGFDPALRKLSPGTVLLAHVVKKAIEEGNSEFDFLRNPEPYKYRWGAVDQPTSRVLLSNRRIDLVRIDS